jgi:DNA-binding response OmpR family regulator
LKSRILLVDDEHDNKQIFTMGLQDAGFEVDAYTDPELALSAFKPDYYDLLLLDIKMQVLAALSKNQLKWNIYLKGFVQS